MEIQTNYNIHRPLMTNTRNSKIYPSSANINFEGIKLPKKSGYNQYLKDVANKYSDILNMDKNTLFELFKGTSAKRISFFKALSNKYHAQNYMLSEDLAENSEHIIDIFNTVKKPNDYHFYIVERINGSIENLKDIFMAANDKKSLKFVKDYTENISRKDNLLLLNILKSPNKKLYINNLEEYRAYLVLNKNEEKAVQKLDNLIKKNDYSRDLYEVRLAIKKLFKDSNLPTNEVLNEKTLLNGYSPLKLDILDTFINTYLLAKNNLSETAYKSIMDIYNTTDKHNLTFRQNVLQVFKHSAEDVYGTKLYTSEIEEIKQLLLNSDNDKHVKNFVNKIIKSDINIHNAKEVNDILKIIPAKKADIFFNNLRQIINNTRGEDRYNALLKEITNPFYIRDMRRNHYKRIGYKPYYSTSIFDDAKAYTKNKFNILRDKLTPQKDFEISDEIPDTMKDVKKHKDSINISKVKPTYTPISRERSLAPIFTKSILEKTLDNINNHTYAPIKLPKINELLKQNPAINISINDVKKTSSSNNALSVIQEPIILQKTLDKINSTSEAINKSNNNIQQEQTLPLKKSFKELKKARKLKVISDINNIIEKKLGPKTLDKQKAEYEQLATKIRLSLLPEIFDSIKASRQLERDLGAKRPSISNQDAVKLYNRINGNNRKLVRYMLMKTKSKTDNTRIFTIKDIIKVLDEAEKEIPIYKTIDSTYKPRTHYNEIFDKYVEQYGKLSRHKKNS